MATKKSNAGRKPAVKKTGPATAEIEKPAEPAPIASMEEALSDFGKDVFGADVGAVVETTPRKVRVCAVLRGTYGNYNPGEIAEFEKPIADAFVKDGICTELE